ncbi:MAG: cytochrome c-type biogenesis protein CcmH [Gemmatimonadetes bacterium]|nr:cytochrome c-type biogenesis protein CcmH [Gemmatimonadota bacterium]NIR78425.1 cytochrome c-type biogenesis protein CcmH [Gemmatimonadota bacterium]NIT87037.1 cytochrome c-type biogenesis protein CcmH [Gemmatimonadota bacterium]NIU30875.1 cytochrome c-type biogenesis protein CcmH [Gemmatimonadota bacterium]NIU35644.1 cytochrome c-type biogenesis protein CcmH [Gemmatimonadota bacterium]
MSVALLALTLASLTAPAVGPAVGPGHLAAVPSNGRDLDSLTTAIARRLRCPVCRQLSVEDSPSELAREVKGVIRSRLERGETEAEVVAYFVSKYGEWILLEPPKKGFNLLVWLVPVLGLLVGGGALGLAFRRWLRAGATAEPGAGAADPQR